MRIAVNMNGEKKELYMGKGVINRIQKYGPDESPAEVLFGMAGQMQRHEVAQAHRGIGTSFRRPADVVPITLFMKLSKSSEEKSPHI